VSNSSAVSPSAGWLRRRRQSRSWRQPAVLSLPRTWITRLAELVGQPGELTHRPAEPVYAVNEQQI
jgi:hypothetical protein